MKLKTLAGGIGLATVLALFSLWGQPAKPTPQQEFMRQKLEHSKAALEGLATEDYDLIARSARKLSAMSQEGGWRVFENPGYAQHSDLFRRNVNALAKAATDRNLDGATLAYVKVTMSCVECHKFVRGKETAQGPGGAPTLSAPGDRRADRPAITALSINSR